MLRHTVLALLIAITGALSSARDVREAGARGEPAAVSLEQCDRIQIADCTILDSDGAGLRLHDVTRSRVAGCVIRDDRGGRPRVPSLDITGGRENWVLHNWLANGWEIEEGSSRLEANLKDSGS
ncbi:MAG: right-handed parallel beta-helix repeat-containing protein [Candidatus Sumerlaeia bacterium]|nr:right-handed parallel beta-helix repeat-containing protein [Candidatus Sumerlaeia bacterium]